MNTPTNRPYTPRVNKALALAGKKARDMGDNYIGSEHLLFGFLLAVDSGPVFDAMQAAKIDRKALFDALDVFFGRDR